MEVTKLFWLKKFFSTLRKDISSKPMEALLVAATVVLAIYTYKLWYSTNELLVDAKESSITNQRAWVGPMNASMNAIPGKSQPIEVAIEYQNTGREPAVNFIHTIEMSTAFTKDFFPKIPDDSNDAVVSMSGWVVSCDPSKEKAGPVVFPTSGVNSYRYGDTLDKKRIDGSVISGDKVILVQGCFAYKTMGKVHHSLFCYYYKSGTTKITSLDICPSGQYAD